jgi:hypothetical protein
LKNVTKVDRSQSCKIDKKDPKVGDFSCSGQTDAVCLIQVVSYLLPIVLFLERNQAIYSICKNVKEPRLSVKAFLLPVSMVFVEKYLKLDET